MFIVHVHCSLFMFIVHCSHGATLIFDDVFLVSVLGHAACCLTSEFLQNPELTVFFSFFFNGAIYSGHTMTGLAMAPNRFPMSKCMPLNEL